MFFRYVVFSLIWFWQFFCPGLSSFGFFSAYILDLFSFFPLGHFFRIRRRLSLSYIDQVGHRVVLFLWLTATAFLL